MHYNTYVSQCIYQGKAESLRARAKAEATQLRNEAQRNCVSLRSELEDEVICEGQDERQLPGALDSPASHHRRSMLLGKRTSSEGRHVGLDFNDLLIEALMGRAPSPHGRVRYFNLWRCRILLLAWGTIPSRW